MTVHSFTRKEAHFESEREHELYAKRDRQDHNATLLRFKGANSC